jgi:hypothetical protein
MTHDGPRVLYPFSTPPSRAGAPQRIASGHGRDCRNGDANPAGAGSGERCATMNGRLMRIPHRAPADSYPLSSAQHRLWFIDQLHPGHHGYNVPRAVRLNGPLDRGALDTAFSAIISRHEILRTSYAVIDGEPRQRIHPASPWVTPVEEAAHLLADPAGQIARVVEELRQPFDLASGRALRTRLLRLAPDAHILIATIHHTATDTMTIVFNELAALYEAALTGRPAALPDLPIQYADYAVWERTLLSGDHLTRLRAFWTRQLAGAPTAVRLPLAGARPSTVGTTGDRYYFEMARFSADDVGALARAEKTTPYAVFLAAFATLLFAASGQEDILISSPAACRELPELVPLVGCFANTILLRVDLTSRPTFRQVVGRAARAVWGAVAHRRLPFDQMVDIVKPARDGTRVSLGQVNFRVAGPDTVDLAGLAATLLPVHNAGSKFELAVQFSGGQAAYLEYNVDLFDRPRIMALARDLERLLTTVLSHPDTPLPGLDFRPETEAASGRPSLKGFRRRPAGSP